MVRIQDVAPDLEILFMGAAALGLPGKNDIDLDILCDNADIARYVQILVPILGEPQEIKHHMVIWNYMYKDVEIDCILSDPNAPGSHVPMQQKTFEQLKCSSELQERFKQLKYRWDGLPYKEYEARKKAFLQEIEVM